MTKRGVKLKRVDGKWVEIPCTCFCHEPGNEDMKHFIACCGTPKEEIDDRSRSTD